MKTNQEYKNAALASLKGNWGQPVLATLLMAVLVLALIAMCVIAEFAWNPDPVGDEMSIWTICFYMVSYICSIILWEWSATTMLSRVSIETAMARLCPTCSPIHSMDIRR